jgi:dimethylhistidine N-methyltransferase
MSEFLQDVLTGLRAKRKHLDSKYFYDEVGDELFRQIMSCPEYYLSRCELEILSFQKDAIVDAILDRIPTFDIVELGAGDCSKSIHLLDALQKHNIQFTYYPIDISSNVIALLDGRVSARLPGLKLKGLNGDYFDMLDKLKTISARFKVVLFLGSSIGNIPLDETVAFFRQIHSHLLPGDLLLTGFDLKKDPGTILAAYNDREGLTRRFNLNLLERINKTFGADFKIERFAHRPVYHEDSGACESYLESLEEQTVHIGNETIHFNKGEQVYMEVSQKFTVQQTDEIGAASGFTVLNHFCDSKKWFLDALWQIPMR